MREGREATAEETHNMRNPALPLYVYMKPKKRFMKPSVCLILNSKVRRMRAKILIETRVVEWKQSSTTLCSTRTHPMYTAKNVFVTVFPLVSIENEKKQASTSKSPFNKFVSRIIRNNTSRRTRLNLRRGN